MGFLSSMFDIFYYASHILTVYASPSGINSFYDSSLKIKDADGSEVKLDKFIGKVSLVVNVASKCGFTDGHYKGLVELQNRMNKIGDGEFFNVLAFPCNQFGSQETQCSLDVIKTMKPKYKVNFQIYDKINVLNEDVPVAWQYLIGETGKAPNWNFWKYLVDVDGKVIACYNPMTSVRDIGDKIEELVTKASKIKHDEM